MLFVIEQKKQRFSYRIMLKVCLCVRLFNGLKKVRCLFRDIVGNIGKGILVLLGIKKDDDKKDADYLSDKIINLRIFEDENGKMNLVV